LQAIVDTYSRRTGKMWIEYETREAKHPLTGKPITEIKVDGKWETYPKLAERFGASADSIRRRVVAGVPLNMSARARYCSGGPLDGQFLLEKQIAEKTGMSTGAVQNRTAFGVFYQLAPAGKYKGVQCGQKAIKPMPKIKSKEAKQGGWGHLVADFAAARRNPMAAWR